MLQICLTLLIIHSTVSIPLTAMFSTLLKMFIFYYNSVFGLPPLSQTLSHICAFRCWFYCLNAPLFCLSLHNTYLSLNSVQMFSLLQSISRLTPDKVSSFLCGLTALHRYFCFKHFPYYVMMISLSSCLLYFTVNSGKTESYSSFYSQFQTQKPVLKNLL